MNVYVLMIVCVSRARESNFSPPRWSARRRCCSPGCLPTPHTAARPARAWKASGARNRPRMVLDDRVRPYLRVYLRFCLRVENRRSVLPSVSSSVRASVPSSDDRTPRID